MSIFLKVSFENQNIVFDFDRSFSYKHFICGLTKIFENITIELSFKIRLFNDEGKFLSPEIFNNFVSDISNHELKIYVVLDNDRQFYEKFEKDLLCKTTCDFNCSGTPNRSTKMWRKNLKGEKYVRL